MALQFDPTAFIPLGKRALPAAECAVSTIVPPTVTPRVRAGAAKRAASALRTHQHKAADAKKKAEDEKWAAIMNSL